MAEKKKEPLFEKYGKTLAPRFDRWINVEYKLYKRSDEFADAVDYFDSLYNEKKTTTGFRRFRKNVQTLVRNLKNKFLNKIFTKKFLKSSVLHGSGLPLQTFRVVPTNLTKKNQQPKNTLEAIRKSKHYSGPVRFKAEFRITPRPALERGSQGSAGR